MYVHRDRNLANTSGKVSHDQVIVDRRRRAWTDSRQRVGSNDIVATGHDRDARITSHHRQTGERP